ncbi:MAG: ethylbenzene dehydrogenase-related protein [Candidatus Binatia bacterium]
MSSKPVGWLVGASLTLLVGLPPAAGAVKQAHKAPVKGKAVYLQHCAVCHGPNGDGKGPAAYLLFPKPRDFTRGVFKFRSTPTIPTDADLLRTVTQGVPGTAMPGWSNLSADDRQAVITYIKSLSDRFAKPAIPLDIPKPPELTPELVTAGKQLYLDAGCDTCHGLGGRGDGGSAGQLKDEWGFPITPRDLTRPSTFKEGGTPESIYRVIMVGIGGTPMPTFAGALTDEQAWQLVAYVRSLAHEGQETLPPSAPALIVAQHAASRIDPQDPFAKAWETVTPVAVRLMTLWKRPAVVPEITVRALYDDRDLGLLVEWEDASANFAAARPQDFSDAVAVQFPLANKAPSFTMGETAGAVNIWHWRANRELEAASYALAKTYPDQTVDMYPLDADPTFQTARAVGNAVAAIKAPASVTELNAEGFGTLTPQPADDQQIRGRGAWRDGKWHVVIVRSLKTTSPRDRQFAAGQQVPVAFAVWNGAEQDRNGQKAVSVWQQLRIGSTP